MRSLFRRVTRYSVASSLDPRENRLTEVTAAILEHVEGIAETFVRQLLGASEEDAKRRNLGVGEAERRADLCELARGLVPERAEVNTQLATRNGRFVDLEVLLRPQIGASERGLLMWVEAKHGAPLSGDQLDAYLHDIEGRVVEGNVGRVVVLLVPRGGAPIDVPAGVVVADWQGVGNAVRDADAEAQPPVQRWLLAQYIRYLQEEGLTDPEALTTVSALALMEVHAGEAAAAGICEYADDEVEVGWGTRGAHRTTRGKAPTPAFGTDYWVNRDSHRKGQQPNPNWRGAWFEWGLRDTASTWELEDARGSWVFMAGATLITNDDPTKIDGNEEWYARRLADGFKYFWISSYWRLARVRYPDELLAETTLETQGRELGRWVVDTFDALAGDPPPQ